MSPLWSEIARREAALAAEPVPETEFGRECREAGRGYLDGLRAAAEFGSPDALRAAVGAASHALDMWQGADPEPDTLRPEVGMTQTRLTSYLRALRDVLRRMERKEARS